MTPHELMLLVMIGGIVVLTVFWSVARWRTGAREADPGARLLAVVAMVALGWLMSVSELRAWFWGLFAAAVGIFVAEWIRERIARRG